MLNFTIFTRSTPHALRAICLAVFPPAFIMLLVQGIISHDVNPAIGILPLFFSAAFAALLLANEKKCGCQASGLTGTPIHLVLDVLIGVGLLVCLILAWVNWSGRYYCDTGIFVLGAYGTNFLICNFLIHLYFVGKQVQETLGPGPSYPMSCPQCQNSSFSVGGIKLKDIKLEDLKLMNRSTTSRDGYAPLLDPQGEPRASVEETTPTPDAGDMA